MYSRSPYLGVSIVPHQTRIIRLHGGHGDPGSPLVCDVLAAEILHPRFKGLGIHDPSGVDYLSPFDALSYCWGSSNAAQHLILCNGIERRISENLFRALRNLRDAGARSRHVWADAICINQHDDVEKSNQVSLMLLIYEQAARVIGWLGAVSDEAMATLSLLTNGSTDDIFSEPKKFETVMTGLLEIYTRPWFGRMWVQQEIFAARQLVIQCEDTAFEWTSLPYLSRPSDMFSNPHFNPHYAACSDSDKVIIQQKFGFTVPDVNGASTTSSRVGTPLEVFKSQLSALSSLVQLHQKKLANFDRFSAPPTEFGRDLLHVLLRTAPLAATNPKDHIFAILGITTFPSRSMPIHQWVVERGEGVFIPIDYSADLRSILCTVTWAMLMKYGPSILAKFKLFSHQNGNENHDGNHSSEIQELPSWVIDWRLTGRMFREKQLNGQGIDFWARHRHAALPGFSRTILKNGRMDHLGFYYENSHPQTPYDQLVVRGKEISKVCVEGDHVYLKAGSWYNSATTEPLSVEQDTKLFQLDQEVPTKEGDIVVQLFDLENWAHVDRHAIDTKGLWVLRPASTTGDTTYAWTLVACLSWYDIDKPFQLDYSRLGDIWDDEAGTLYAHWNLTDDNASFGPGGPYRRLTASKKKTEKDRVSMRSSLFGKTDHLKKRIEREFADLDISFAGWRRSNLMEENPHIRTFTIV